MISCEYYGQLIQSLAHLIDTQPEDTNKINAALSLTRHAATKAYSYTNTLTSRRSMLLLINVVKTDLHSTINYAHNQLIIINFLTI